MSHSTRPPRRASGFSLVEFLMVAMILGVGLLGLAALSAISIRGFGGSRTRDTATNLANNVLDRLALDGRSTGMQRVFNVTIPAAALLANATDGVSNAYTDPATGFTAFDIQGLPTNTTPVYTVTWVRRASKTGLTASTTGSFAGAEVVVNVKWNDAIRNDATGATTTQAHYISISRYMSY